MGAVGWAALLGLVPAALGDVYMHNPRGSNDRNCERNVNRNNGNRLFDSQNNAKGGYACPRAVGDESRQNEAGEAIFNGFTQNKKMYFYEGSILPIEWTNQHGCGQHEQRTAITNDVHETTPTSTSVALATVPIRPQTSSRSDQGSGMAPMCSFGRFAGESFGLLGWGCTPSVPRFVSMNRS